MKKLTLIFPLPTAIAAADGTGLVPVTRPVVYSDGRPCPSYRMETTDFTRLIPSPDPR
jgi:hypothetical protein